LWIGPPVGEVELGLLLPGPLTALEVLGEVDAKRIMRLTLRGSSILVVYAKGLPPDQPSERHTEAPLFARKNLRLPKANTRRTI
jgi:hypothetical protein